MKNMAMHMLDIAENAVRAGATHIRIRLESSQKHQTYVMLIQDDGAGMDRETLEKATDPYFSSRKTRKIGLGLPLLKQNATLTGGEFRLESEPGKGTKVEAVFRQDHLDCLPEGDIADAFVFLLSSHPERQWTLAYQKDGGCYEVSSQEIKEVLGGTPLHISEVRKFLTEMINENIKTLT